jgi:hypothetical protein
MAAVFPNALNTFIRDHDASNKMVIDYARNTKDFVVNQYAQVVPTKKLAGYYLKMTVEEAGRIQETDLANFVWPDGQPSPEFNNGTESFNFLPFECLRYAYGFNLGDLTIDQASWDILAQHASIKARQAMTARTQLAVTALTTAANYDATHALNVTLIAGNTGNWAQSTTARQDIKRSLITASELILDDTLSAVDLNDLVLVVSSSLAGAMSESQEIVDHIKGSPDALAQVRGELPGQNAMYGLPAKLYGIPVVVEKTRKVTSRKGAAATTRASIFGSTVAVLCSRPGGLIGVSGAPSFSTLTIFAQEEMSVESRRDNDNRRTVGRCIDCIVAKVTAPASGVLFSACQ